MENYNVAVVGAGPGGYIAAICSAQYGLKTALIEKNAAGGMCLNWGCIPSKILIKNAILHQKIKKLAREGIYSEKIPDLNTETLFKKSRAKVKEISEGLERLIESHGVHFIHGSARLTSSGSIMIAGKRGTTEIKSSNIIIATGAASKPLELLPTDGERIITSKEALMLSQPPKKLCIIGGGAIGCEMATLFSALGSEVTILELMPQLLPDMDEDIAEGLKNEFKIRGINIRLSARISGIKKLTEEVQIEFSAESGKETESADCIIIAAGITPIDNELGLKDAGVAFSRRGFILVDSRTYKTSIPNIYAVGDAIELASGEKHPALAHVACAEGEIAAEVISRGSSSWDINYANIPLAIFTDPEIGAVGCTQAEARKKFNGGFRAQTVLDGWLGIGIALGETGFTKIMTENRFNTIIGAHIMGHAATERIHQFSIAQRAEETVETMLRQTMAHPTFSESTREALLALCGKSAHVPTELCRGKI